jgi:hypothetical protein
MGDAAMNHQSGMPVIIDVGASAKLNIDVKTEIPPEATGRLLDTITQLLSPWAEARALRADKIRLQRLDVAAEIAKRATRLIESYGQDVRPIPLKLMVPLLEKGSQEAPRDDFMIDAWANLLASAATDRHQVAPRFVSILADLNGSQARLLLKMDRRTNNPTAQIFGLMRGVISSSIADCFNSSPTDEEFLNKLAAFLRTAPLFPAEGWIDRPGSSRTHFGLWILENLDDDVWQTFYRGDPGILKSLGLLDDIEVSTFARDSSLWLRLFQVSLTGQRFVECVSPRGSIQK